LVPLRIRCRPFSKNSPSRSFGRGGFTPQIPTGWDPTNRPTRPGGLDRAQAQPLAQVGPEAGTKRCSGAPARASRPAAEIVHRGAAHLQGRRSSISQAGGSNQAGLPRERPTTALAPPNLNSEDFQPFAPAGPFGVAACSPSASHASERCCRGGAWPGSPHASSYQRQEPCAVFPGWRH
jgi:hypothetical protein